MKLVSSHQKPHGLIAFVFEHVVKGERRTFSIRAMNESNARVKAWKHVSDIYKSLES
jgi:hypothetical protein